MFSFSFLCSYSLYFSGTEYGKFSIPFGLVKRQPQAWWSTELEEAVSQKCSRAFPATHRSDEGRQAYIYASRHASSDIPKAKDEAWEATCSSLSPKSVYYLIRSISGSSYSPNFPYCPSPRESATVFTNYLRSHFLSPSQKPWAEEPTCPSFNKLSAQKSLIPLLAPPFQFCSPSSCSGMDFLQLSFNLSQSMSSLPSIWNTFIIPINKMGGFSTSLLSFDLSLSPPASQSFLSTSFFTHLLLFLKPNFIFSPS